MMQPTILITDGGPHGADKWAVVTAGQIISIAAGSESAGAIAGRRLELQVLDILERHYGSLQTGERGKLTAEGDDRIAAPLGGGDLCEPVVDEIIAAAAASVFVEHFAKPEVREHIHTLLHTHADNALAIERSWHARRNPDGKHARAFLDRHKDGVTKRPKVS